MDACYFLLLRIDAAMVSGGGSEPSAIRYVREKMTLPITTFGYSSRFIISTWYCLRNQGIRIRLFSTFLICLTVNSPFLMQSANMPPSISDLSDASMTIMSPGLMTGHMLIPILSGTMTPYTFSRCRTRSFRLMPQESMSASSILSGWQADFESLRIGPTLYCFGVKVTFG